MVTMTTRAQHHYHDGFLHQAFAASPWLGAMLVVLIVVVGLLLALLTKAGRVLYVLPWYVRLALLATAGLGVFRLLSRRRATPDATPQPPGPPAARSRQPSWARRGRPTAGASTDRRVATQPAAAG